MKDTLTLSLRPYFGTVRLCRTQDALRREYRRLTKQNYPYTDDPKGGRYVRLEFETLGDMVWLVWAADQIALAHEFCHVLLQVFREVGHDATQGDGEPFCYMLSQLLKEAK